MSLATFCTADDELVPVSPDESLPPLPLLGLCLLFDDDDFVPLLLLLEFPAPAIVVFPNRKDVIEVLDFRFWKELDDDEFVPMLFLCWMTI